MCVCVCVLSLVHAYPRVLRLIRLLKLVRMAKLARVVAALEEEYEVSPTVLRLFKLSFQVMDGVMGGDV